MSKNNADEVKRISVNFLKKHDYFCGWRCGTITWTSNSYYGENKSSVGVDVSLINGDSYARIHYTQTDRDTEEKKDFDYKIPLVTTPCRYGGKRYWFICPWYKNKVYCGKRVGTLYKDGDYFACRHCYNLAYSSQKVNRRYKLFPLFDVFNFDDKISALEKQIKRRYYKGKPTKKQRKLERLYRRANINYGKFAKLEKENVL
jgi:hypothetical protein